MSFLKLKPLNYNLSYFYRLADHLESCDTFSLSRIKFLVIDEADRLLGGAFDEQLQTIFSRLPTQRQTLLFSATMTDALDTVKQVATNQVIKLGFLNI